MCWKLDIIIPYHSSRWERRKKKRCRISGLSFNVLSHFLGTAFPTSWWRIKSLEFPRENVSWPSFAQKLKWYRRLWQFFYSDQPSFDKNCDMHTCQLGKIGRNRCTLPCLCANIARIPAIGGFLAELSCTTARADTLVKVITSRDKRVNLQSIKDIPQWREWVQPPSLRSHSLVVYRHTLATASHTFAVTSMNELHLVFVKTKVRIFIFWRILMPDLRRYRTAIIRKSWFTNLN